MDKHDCTRIMNIILYAVSKHKCTYITNIKLCSVDKQKHRHHEHKTHGGTQIKIKFPGLHTAHMTALLMMEDPTIQTLIEP